MEISREELERRLEAAAHARANLRRATLERRELGERLLRERERVRDEQRPDRPHDSHAGRR